MRFERIRRARIAAGITMAEVAQVAGKTGGWVYAIERSVCTPSREDAEKVATLLGAKPEELFSRIRPEQEC